MKKVKLCCIIDDDPIFIFSISKIIKMVDFCEEFITFEDGKEAINGLINIVEKKEPFPDVIFLDINMPIMDGWDFLEEFQNLNLNLDKKIHIYIVTSSIDQNDIEKTKQFNSIEKYIVKPVTANKIKELIESF